MILLCENALVIGHVLNGQQLKTILVHLIIPNTPLQSSWSYFVQYQPSPLPLPMFLYTTNQAICPQLWVEMYLNSA